jgi:hypothetical protein
MVLLVRRRRRFGSVGSASSLRLILCFVVAARFALDPLSSTFEWPETNDPSQYIIVSPTKKQKKPSYPRHLELKMTELPARQKRLDEFSPPVTTYEGYSLQLDDELFVMIGGYYNKYNSVYRGIQFFNITSQKWLADKSFDLPEGVAETHAGSVFDPDTRMLYIISGQVGAGCSSATRKSVRIHMDTGRYESLPSLPAPRFHPAVTLVQDPLRSSVKHIHVVSSW